MQREKETREVEVIRFLRSLEELAKSNPETLAPPTPEKKSVMKPKGAPPNPMLVCHMETLTFYVFLSGDPFDNA